MVSKNRQRNTIVTAQSARSNNRDIALENEDATDLRINTEGED